MNNQQNELVANVNYSKDKFTNRYVTSSAQASIQFNKTLTGRSLNADEFTFELFDETGNLVKSATNLEDEQSHSH